MYSIIFIKLKSFIYFVLARFEEKKLSLGFITSLVIVILTRKIFLMIIGIFFILFGNCSSMFIKKLFF